MAEQEHPRPSSSFILIVLLLLGLLHLYIGWRLIPALTHNTTCIWIAILFLTVSCLSMPLSLGNHASGPFASFADRLSSFGSFMMSLFSTLLVLTLARDIVLLCALPIVESSTMTAFDSRSAWAVCIATLIVTGVGYMMARRLAPVRRIQIELPLLPVALEGFTIVQISDIHVGPTIKRAFLERVVRRVNQLNADLIAITGDVVDGTVAQLTADTEVLAGLVSRHGSYFVTGNHEYYFGAQQWMQEFRRLGLIVLENRHVVIEHQGAHLLIAGVNDYSARHQSAPHNSDPLQALAGAPAGVGAKILLAHQPRSAEQAAVAGYDLQLSGHTHGGQFWPWTPFVKLQQPFIVGLHRVQRMWLYISRGTGYWGPPNRFGVPSEITHLTLTRVKTTALSPT
jgi:predicted MPP superfamily phosphohydrolase